MTATEKLTKADKDALSLMPDEWFSPDNLHHMIRNPRFRCDRLRDMGLLEWRVVGALPDLKSEYRKIAKGDSNYPLGYMQNRGAA